MDDNKNEIELPLLKEEEPKVETPVIQMPSVEETKPEPIAMPEIEVAPTPNVDETPAVQMPSSTETVNQTKDDEESYSAASSNESIEPISNVETTPLTNNEVVSPEPVSVQMPAEPVVTPQEPIASPVQEPVVQAPSPVESVAAPTQDIIAAPVQEQPSVIPTPSMPSEPAPTPEPVQEMQTPVNPTPDSAPGVELTSISPAVTQTAPDAVVNNEPAKPATKDNKVAKIVGTVIVLLIVIAIVGYLLVRYFSL